VRRVVAASDPEQIILFGSARGAMRPDSDLDLLVIKAGPYDYHRLISDIYKAGSGADIPVEIVLVTPEQAERYKDSFCLVIHPALKEGKVIYDRAALRTRRLQKVAPNGEGPRSAFRRAVLLKICFFAKPLSKKPLACSTARLCRKQNRDRKGAVYGPPKSSRRAKKQI
jgi:predicted nucleotidyltransferase